MIDSTLYMALLGGDRVRFESIYVGDASRRRRMRADVCSKPCKPNECVVHSRKVIKSWKSKQDCRRVEETEESWNRILAKFHRQGEVAFSKD